MKCERNIRKASGDAASCIKVRLDRSQGMAPTIFLYSFSVFVLFAFLHTCIGGIQYVWSCMVREESVFVYLMHRGQR